MPTVPNLSSCAVPLCSNTWHTMSEGKLFVFHQKNHSSEECEVRRVWLCDECFQSWEAMLDEHGQVILQPSVRKPD